MDDLHRRILAEKENVETALSNLKEAMARKEKTIIEAHLEVLANNIPVIWLQFMKEIEK